MLRAILFVLCCSILFAQHKVPPEYMYHRVYAVVPLVGTGSGSPC